MIYKASNLLKEQLSNLPETGMGYQILELEPTPAYRFNSITVINSELILDNDYKASWESYLSVEGHDKTMLSAEKSIYTTDINIKNVVALSKSNTSYRVTETGKCGRKSGGKGATDNPKRYAKENEIFIRVSPFANDHRIDFDNKCLKKGSFTTTINDYKECIGCYPLPDKPIDRYALPSDEDIRWSFIIVPKTYNKLREGIVQPAFGKKGGGEEAYFDDGTSFGTFIKRIRYGKEGLSDI